MTDRDKDLNYIVPLWDSKFWKIPKGRLTSVVANAAQRSIRQISGRMESKEAWNDYLGISYEQIGPMNLIRNNFASGLISMGTGELVRWRLFRQAIKNET